MNAFNRLKIFLTEDCNLNCSHCYLGKKKREHIDFDLLTRRIKEAKDLGVRIIDLTGGEPSVHPVFLEILETVGGLEFERINLSTNGFFLIKPEMLREIVKHRVCCGISLDGVDQATVDRIRGEGTFSKLMNVFRTLKESGVKFYFRFSINRSNFHQAKEMVLFARDWQTPADLEITQLSGNANEDQILNLAEVDKVRIALSRIDYCGIQIEECFTYPIPCDGGQSDILAINLKGEGVSCLAIERILNQKNVRISMDGSLREIWLKVENQKRILRNFSPILEQCGSCRYLGVCQSGCCITAVSRNCLLL
jgi:radical SAM protein with 4Fe4S-binding SPASM domain